MPISSVSAPSSTSGARKKAATVGGQSKVYPSLSLDGSSGPGEPDPSAIVRTTVAFDTLFPEWRESVVLPLTSLDQRLRVRVRQYSPHSKSSIIPLPASKHHSHTHSGIHSIQASPASADLLGEAIISLEGHIKPFWEKLEIPGTHLYAFYLTYFFSFLTHLLSHTHSLSFFLFSYNILQRDRRTSEAQIARSR